MQNEIITLYHIYDRIFKKILTLSTKAIVNLINGLFDTDYPTDSKITYNWTEFHDDKLRRTLADTIITINDVHSYHIEAQMYQDKDILFRVFDYGYQHANVIQNRNSQNTLTSSNDISTGTSETPHSQTLFFPEPKIIYFADTKNIPDEYILNLDFGSQGIFHYKVPTFKFLDFTPEELTRKKLIILIPFELLKLRDAIQKERTPEKLAALRHLIFHDIIDSIKINLEAGNITIDDAERLKRLTHKLYAHIYSHYDEMEELNDMTDESLILDIDIIEKEHEKKLAEKDAEIADKNSIIAALQAEIEALKHQKA